LIGFTFEKARFALGPYFNARTEFCGKNVKKLEQLENATYQLGKIC
jgi:hypothetical protein